MIATSPTTELPRGFKGVWIRASLWRRMDLSWFQKCLLAEIDNLQDGCFASNRHLAKIMGVPERTLTNNLAELRKKHLLLDCGFDGRRRQIMVADCVSSDPAHNQQPENGAIDVNTASKQQEVHLPEIGYAAYPISGTIDTRLDSSLSEGTKEPKETPLDGQVENRFIGKEKEAGQDGKVKNSKPSPSEIPQPPFSARPPSPQNHPKPAPESNGDPNAAVYESTWKPDTRTKEQKLAALRMPSNYPSELAFDQFVIDEGLTMVEGRDTYLPLCRSKWRHWNGRRWVMIRDWKAYVRALNDKMEAAKYS